MIPQSVFIDSSGKGRQKIWSVRLSGRTLSPEADHEGAYRRHSGWLSHAVLHCVPSANKRGTEDSPVPHCRSSGTNSPSASTELYSALPVPSALPGKDERRSVSLVPRRFEDVPVGGARLIEAGELDFHEDMLPLQIAEPRPYDPDRARALLAEAGYPEGKGLPPLLHYQADRGEVGRKADEILREDLAAVGLDLQYVYTEWEDFSEDLDQHRLPSFGLTWVADLPDPDSFLASLFHTEGAYNLFQYSNPEVDGLLDQGSVMRSSMEWPRNSISSCVGM